ncbi:MAG: HAMP domain-containing sensor histidine kinase [Allobranchiibius sp.]
MVDTRPVSWWSRRSLRARLTAAATVVIALGMLIAAALLVWRVHTSLVANLDATVTNQAQNVSVDAARGSSAGKLPSSGDGAPIVQVVAGDGQVVAGSSNLDHPTVTMFTAPKNLAINDPLTSTQRGVDDGDGDGDGPYRVAVLKVRTPAGPVTVYAALPTKDIQQSTSELIGTLAAGVPLLSLALALVAWLLVGRALKPVESIRRQAAALPGTGVIGRLEPALSNDELGRLTDTFNDLLARIETSSATQRQFVADAAHELRNPVAALRAQLEISTLHPDTHVDVARLGEMLTDTERLSYLVDDLLALARMDANTDSHRQLVDLDDLVLDEVRRAGSRGVRVDASAVSAGQVLGDRAALDRIARNLLDNAVRHAHTSVVVRLESTPGEVVLTVGDDGPGIAPADRQRVFERFTRLDDARGRDAGGAGLGLAIVHDVVIRHGGKVRITDNHPGAVFTVTLPAAP